MARGVGVLTAVLLLAAPACAKSGGDEVEPNHRPVTVEVKNQFALPMEILANGSGIDHRLGTVHPGMRGTFRLPQAMIGGGSVRFEARPSGSGRPFQSGDLLIAPGSVVDFVIAAQLFNSTVTLRP
ncbi:MAG TPA: hypothetical protein VG500_04260 [Gemmatimonadales bacterium]|nr:hypothetical protein [Gemmatimonadales bacterium]